MAGPSELPTQSVDRASVFIGPPAGCPDLADVKGQPLVKRALLISAAGAHNLLQVGPPEAVTFLESFRVNLFKGFIVVLHALVEGGQVRLSRPVDRAGFGHRFGYRQTGEEGGSNPQGAQKARGVPGGGGWGKKERPDCLPDLSWCERE